VTRLPALPDEEAESRLSRFRLLIIYGLICIFVLAPAVAAVRDHKIAPAEKWFVVTGSIVFIGLVLATLRPGPPDTDRAPWPRLILILALGISLFVVGRQSSLTALVVAAAVCGRFTATQRPARLAALACMITGLVVAVQDNLGWGNTVSVILVGPLAAFFAYSAGKRQEAMAALRRTRAELARAAVAEERLRIARDLHDLLGHSLSLITLKAQLAGRVVGTDPARAAKEIGDLESVARQSLSDVRAAVAGFRQPDLSGELQAASQLLAAAGISCQLSAPEHYALPQEVDGVLAWAVREGATNIVRHSRATKVQISVSTSPSEATAEISDNGRAAPDDPGRPVQLSQPGSPDGANGRAAVARAGLTFGGSGLAGLAERVRSLGGELAAGHIEPHGFLLRVVVPLRPHEQRA
jgi:two-component system, NarL family, sensor histidine kinase DesK